MQLTEILNAYETLVDEIIDLLQKERSRLRSDPQADNGDMLAQKRDLIDRLSGRLAELRAYQQRHAGIPVFASEQIQMLQQKFMKILQLDREVEKLFLASSLRPYAAPTVPSAAAVSQAYRAVAR